MTSMELVLLHGTFVDEFLIQIVLPLSIFGGLYWWSSRKEKKKKKKEAATVKAKKP
jgi:nicotinamide riboside transporter PnuC